MYDFYSEFSSALKQGDLSAANIVLMKELASILVKDKADFVDMLNESNVSADVDMSDAELIQLFTSNAPYNQKLILGAALLINIHNKKMGFDGEEEMDDELVKQSYFTMKSCFIDEPIDERYSNIAPALLVPIIGAAAKLGTKGIDAASKKRESRMQAEIAREKLREEARRKREEQRAKKEEERAKAQAKQTKMLIIGGVAVVGILLIGIFLLRGKNQNKK